MACVTGQRRGALARGPQRTWAAAKQLSPQADWQALLILPLWCSDAWSNPPLGLKSLAAYSKPLAPSLSTGDKKMSRLVRSGNGSHHAVVT
jgi:hypothetical protein